MSRTTPRSGLPRRSPSGWIALEGQVEWNFQKRAAEDAVKNLRGIRGVTNEIVVTPHAHAGDVKQNIEAAFRRSAEIDSHNIVVETSDSSVTLRGVVRSWAEHEDALNAAWAAPGVTKVLDRSPFECETHAAGQRNGPGGDAWPFSFRSGGFLNARGTCESTPEDFAWHVNVTPWRSAPRSTRCTSRRRGVRRGRGSGGRSSRRRPACRCGSR